MISYSKKRSKSNKILNHEDYAIFLEPRVYAFETRGNKSQSIIFIRELSILYLKGKKNPQKHGLGESYDCSDSQSKTN